MRFKMGAPLTVSTPAGTGVSLHCSSVLAASQRALPSAPLHYFSAARTVSAGIGSMFIFDQSGRRAAGGGPLSTTVPPRPRLRGCPSECRWVGAALYGAAKSCAACNQMAFAALQHALQGHYQGRPSVRGRRVEREAVGTKRYRLVALG